ncbi:MAG: dihydrodipicolinate reductase, partial [Dehalococcoidia bacterium]|nr:dihydrodipicolinate reductase [Dehalococcoidia bacterium]
MNQFRTVHYGLGPIGLAVFKLAASKERVRPVAAVDIAPEIAGRDAGEVAGLEQPLGIIVSSDSGAALSTDADVVLHCTGSYLDAVQPQLLAAVRAGKNVISTCEELSYPWDRHPQLAADLDREEKAHGVTVLGTGVNPGFVMDTLVLALSGVCQQIA